MDPAQDPDYAGNCVMYLAGAGNAAHMSACDAEGCQGRACGGDGGCRCAGFGPDLVSSAVVCAGIDGVWAGPVIVCGALT